MAFALGHLLLKILSKMSKIFLKLLPNPMAQCNLSSNFRGIIELTMKFFAYYRKRIFAGTVPANMSLFVGTPPVDHFFFYHGRREVKVV